MSTLIVHTDCRRYRGSAPCGLHKQDGRRCETCHDYDPIQERILIVKLAAVGDVLRTTSILPPLKARHSHAHVTWVTQADAAPLLQGNIHIDRVLSVERDYLPHVLNERFSLGICLDADPRSATIHAIARCEQRMGYICDASGTVQPCNPRAADWWRMGVDDTLKRQNRKTYQQIMYGICDLPLPTQRPQLTIPESDAAAARHLLEHPGLTQASRIVGINTGGGGRWQHKKWTTEGYVECIRALRSQHPTVGIILLGGPEETELNREILAQVGQSVIDAGCHNTLMRFAALVALVDVLLTSDSLGMHIGVALEKPTVVLVGPTSPWELDVFGKGAILHSAIDCLACYLSRCSKDPHCMNTLATQTVVDALTRFLT